MLLLASSVLGPFFRFLEVEVASRYAGVGRVRCGARGGGKEGEGWGGPGAEYRTTFLSMRTEE